MINGATGLWCKLGRSPSAETEIFCVANLIGHVRSMLGGGWRPLRVQVSVAEPKVLTSLPLYRGVEISHAARSAIAIPVRDLSRCLNSGCRRSTHQFSAASSRAADLDFLESLRLVMKGYARVGGINVDTVARAAGTSRRTLQRRLSALGVSYSTLADQVRFEVASDLLQQAPDVGITQIGYELGYRDPGSFSRAFKRLAGIAPITYRRRFAPANTSSSTGTSPLAHIPSGLRRGCQHDSGWMTSHRSNPGQSDPGSREFIAGSGEALIVQGKT
jgi:AraC-like DNA-binding protein